MNVTSQFPLYRPDSDPVGFRNRFDLILADPPWQYRDKNSNGSRGAAHKYEVHDVRDIAQLDVSAIAAPNSVLAMWATMPMLPVAFKLMAEWGFEYVTCAFTWVKERATVEVERKAVGVKLDRLGVDTSTAKAIWAAVEPFIGRQPRMGLGHHTRGNAELVLLGRKGKGLERLDKGIPQIVRAPLSVCCPACKKSHSRKPDEVHRRLERLYGMNCRKLELFARRPMPGWSTWGNELHTRDGTPLASSMLMPLKVR